MSQLSVRGTVLQIAFPRRDEEVLLVALRSIRFGLHNVFDGRTHQASATGH